MKTFFRTSLPDSIKYNGKVYKYDIHLNPVQRKSQTYPKGTVLVKVLSRNLRVRTDLHGKPYQPSEFIFSPVKEQSNDN